MSQGLSATIKGLVALIRADTFLDVEAGFLVLAEIELRSYPDRDPRDRSQIVPRGCVF